LSHHRRSPRPVAAPLDHIKTLWQPPSALGQAQSAWDQIGRLWEEVIGAHGSYVVERTQLVSLRAGVLTVSCSESVVADTLELESSGVLKRLNERLEGDQITRLRCVTSG
jgi:Dna[CI] antecedent, DciA